MLNGLPFTVVGKIRKKEAGQQLNGPDNNKIFIPFATMLRDLPRTDAPAGTLSDIVVAPKPAVVDDLPRVLNARTPLEDNRVAARAPTCASAGAPARIRPADDQAIRVWDTSLETLMFGRMIDGMRSFFRLSVW